MRQRVTLRFSEEFGGRVSEIRDRPARRMNTPGARDGKPVWSDPVAAAKKERPLHSSEVYMWPVAHQKASVAPGLSEHLYTQLDE